MIKRNYDLIVDRLKNSVPSNPGHMEIISAVSTPKKKYPLIKVVLGKGNPKRILISGGIHGDEPSGVESITSFIEDKVYENYLDEWEITLLPCLNPFGYEYGSRENHEQKDLNRLFKVENPPAEIPPVKNILDDPFDLNIELHEDVDSPGFYLYLKELPKTDPEFGHDVLEEVKKVMPLNTASEIEGTSAQNGLLARLSDPEDMDWWPMAVYAVSKGSRTCMTVETSTHFPIETRVDAHLTAVKTAMDNYKFKGK